MLGLFSLQEYHMLLRVGVSLPRAFYYNGWKLRTRILGSRFSVFIMGIAESKILLGKLTTACSSAERNKQNNIQHVLLDKQVSYQ
jgi:hypothetical protein